MQVASNRLFSRFRLKVASLKVPFGVRGGELLSPGDVERGLKCGCSCPGCGAPLVANHPKVAGHRKYFSHKASSGCSSGYESALHLAAKRILVEERRIHLPPIFASVQLHDRDTGASATASQYVSAREVCLDSVAEEVRDFDGVVPDIVAIVAGRELLIEIAVTHFVDEQKKLKLQQLGLPVLEVYLDLDSELPSLDEVRNLVVHETYNKSWVVNPKQVRLAAVVHADAERKLVAAVQRVKANRLEKTEAKRRYLSLSDKEKLNTELEEGGLTLPQVAKVIGRRVRFVECFGVSSYVWQLFVYRTFVHERQGDGFDFDEVIAVLDTRFNIERAFPKAPHVALYDYLVWLESSGFLEKDAAGRYVVIRDASGSLLPF